MKDKQPSKFVAAHLSRRGGQDIEHIIHGIAKDGSTKGDGETDEEATSRVERGIDDA